GRRRHRGPRPGPRGDPEDREADAGGRLRRHHHAADPRHRRGDEHALRRLDPERSGSIGEVAFIARTKLLAADEGFALDDFETTAEIAIPDDPLKRVVGQDEAVKLARIAANQRRHFLLVGPPGTGKSMIAQALSLHLPSVTE